LALIEVISLDISCNFILHWLREPALGVLQGGPPAEIGSDPYRLAAAIGAAGDLPSETAEALARKLLSKAVDAADRRPEPGAIEVQFPFLSRKNWKKRAEMAAGYEPHIDEDGRIIFESPEISRLETDLRNALAAGLPGAARHFSFTFTDRRSLTPLQASVWLPILLAGYGFPENEIASVLTGIPGESVEAALTLSLPGECGAAWLSAPDERDPNFFEIYVKMAKAVQSVLRRWLPYVLLRDAANYGDHSMGFPLIVYGATRPYRGRPRSTFTFDILNTELVDLFFRLAARDLEAVAPRIAASLVSAGHPEIARLYGHGRIKSIVESVQRQRRSVNNLLVADTILIEALVKLGCDGNAIGEAASKDPRQAVRASSNACDRLLRAWNPKLRRIYGPEDFRPFGSLLLMEATRGLNPDARLHATAAIRTGAGTRVLVNGGQSLGSS
jgi:hypothetical protein